MSFLGVDVGTQSCKAVLFDEYGSILGESHTAYELVTKGEYVEIPPDLLLSAVRETIVKLTHNCAGGKIETIPFSVLGEAVTPLGKEMNFVGNTVPALDTRSARICEDLKRRRGFRYFYGITGQSIHPMFTLGKILWWKENAPDLFTAAKKFLCWEEIIHYEFCHRCCIDYSLASRTMLFDIRKKRWSEEMLGIAGLEERKLGEVVAPGEILGTVDRRLADELGLPKDTLVVAGGFDQACAALGASVMGPGVLLDNIGTTHCIGAASPSFDVDGKLLGEGFSTVCHVVPGMYFSLGGSHSGGINVKWYLEKLCGQENVNVADYLEQCGSRPAGVVFLPFVYGAGSPDPDPAAKAAILGIRYDTDARDVLKAIVDGISFETMANIIHLRARAVRIESIHSTGGASRSAAWLQTKADVTGLPVLSFNTPEGGCLGCALLGAHAARKFDSLESGARSMVHTTGEYFPNSESARLYKKKFANYERVRDAVRELTRESLEENDGKA